MLHTTYERVVKEKGVGLQPGEEIPGSIRTTAWAFMGQTVSQNYRRSVFGLPLSKPEEFDPKSESIHGLLSGSSHQREEPEEDDEPMNDPYTRPSGFTTRGGSQPREEPQGSSQQREEPRGSSQQREEPTTERHLKISGRITDHHQVVQSMMNLISNRRIMYNKKQQHFGFKKNKSRTTTPSSSQHPQ